MFFGPKITTVFASRWKALAWSAGVLMTAWCSIPSPEDGDKSAVADPAMSAIAGIAGVQGASQTDSRTSWAIASPAPGIDRRKGKGLPGLFAPDAQ